MTCQDIADRLVDFVEDELDDDERALFETHMARCADCAAFLASYLRATELARRAVVQSLPATARERLLDALRATIDPSGGTE